MLHRKPPKAQVVYLPRYVLIQSICLNSHLVENCNGADGCRVISKKIKCPESKSWQVLCTGTIWYWYAFIVPAVSQCDAHLFFSIFYWGNWVKIIILVKVYYIRICIQNKPIYKIYVVGNNIFFLVFHVLIVFFLSCFSDGQLRKYKYNEDNEREKILCNLFNPVSISYVLPFSQTKVTFKITAGVSNSFTP